VDEESLFGWEAEAYEAVDLWRSPSGDPWLITFQLVEVAGRIECAGMWIRSETSEPGAEPRPLTTQTLRALNFATRLLEARRGSAASERSFAAAMLRFSEDHGAPRTPGRPAVKVSPEVAGRLCDAAEAYAAAIAPPPGLKDGRRARFTRRDLELVAELYNRLNADGSPSPTRDTAEAMGLPRTTVAKLVMRARRAGLLPKTRQGVSGPIISREEQRP